jgi:hypothetical protein
MTICVARNKRWLDNDFSRDLAIDNAVKKVVWLRGD